MLQINGAYSPMVGYAQILKKLAYPEILSYHLSHEKGCLRKEVCLGSIIVEWGPIAYDLYKGSPTAYFRALFLRSDALGVDWGVYQQEAANPDK